MKAEENRITAVIITLNEEANITRCLDSLAGIADEILVYDSFSTDQTPAICREKGVRFFQGPWLGFASTKNKANEMVSGTYILSLDADEALSESLRREIKELKENLRGAYLLNRKNFFGGKWVRFCGWYPDRKTRLFPKNQAQWTGENVHETLALTPGTPLQKLNGDLLHYTVSTPDHHREIIRKYSRIKAEESFKKGKKLHLWLTGIKVGGKFVFLFFFRLGFLDGVTGLKVCLGSAWGKYLEYKYLYDLSRKVPPRG